jgi:methionyl-tRNA formyltransferase
MLAGWSWKIENSVVNNSYVVGLHPSDLPNFKGGSPIQNQILQGITKTKASLFKLTECFDDGPVLLQTELSLKGSINNIFKNLKAATITLFNRFLKEETFNKNPPASKNGGSYYKRLSKEDSRVFPKCFLEMNALTLYNLMRCREDPYPNVFIEDKTGRLLFKKVDFIENEDLPSI